MKSYLILTAIGPDRAGLVDLVSAHLADHDFNIESSRMAVLGGEFAMIILVSGEEDQVNQLADDPAGVASSSGLLVFAKKTAGPEARLVPACAPYRIVGSGMDHPGIVHEVSRALHQFNVNIEDLDTQVVPAPVSGAPIFTMEALLAVPAEVKIRALKNALEELSDQLNMEIELQPEEPRR